MPSIGANAGGAQNRLEQSCVRIKANDIGASEINDGAVRGPRNNKEKAACRRDSGNPEPKINREIAGAEIEVGEIARDA